MKVLVLILSTQDLSYAKFIESIRTGWKIELEKRGIKVYFYEGGYQFNYIEGDTLKLTAQDDLLNTARKLKEAIKLLNNEGIDYDMLYRTNLSSFIEADNFERFINALEGNKIIYNGLVGETSKLQEFFNAKSRTLSFLFRKIDFTRKIKFASGSGFFLDKNSSLKIFHSDEYNQYIDDIMVSLVLNTSPNQNQIVPKRFDILEDMNHKIDKKEYFRLIQDECLFHYRFKTKDRNNDAINIKNFCSYDYRLEYCTLGEL